MMRLRAILAGYPTRSILLVVGFAVVVSTGLFISSLDPVVSAHTCSDNWQAAIAARQAGASEFSEGCADFGGFPSRDTTVPDDFYQAQAAAELQAQEELQPIATDVWGFSAGHVAGLPLVISAVLIGALGVGSMLGSGTTAWCLSNGWDRKSWIRSVIGLSVVGTVGLFAVLTAAFAVATLARMKGLDLSLQPGAPDWTVVAPIPGLLLYTVFGITTGLIVGRAETAALAALVVVAGEYIGSGITGWSFLPTVAYQVTLGTSNSTTSPWSAGAGLLVGSVALGAITYAVFTYRRNVPDRPT